jgi:hypothetical protein
MSTGVEQRVDLARPVVESSEGGALALADAYWDEIRRLTLGLVRARAAESGVELSLLGFVALLRFGTPVTTADAALVQCRFPITGGLLAKRSGGSLAIRQRVASPSELAVVVEGYSPRLDSGRERGGIRTFAYHGLQERVHELIGRRYLERMAGERR